MFRVDSSAYGMEADCNEEYLEFFNGGGVDDTSLGRFCGSTPPPPIATTGLEARVVFRASEEHPDHLRGVRVTYSLALLGECQLNHTACHVWGENHWVTKMCRILLYCLLFASCIPSIRARLKVLSFEQTVFVYT